MVAVTAALASPAPFAEILVGNLVWNDRNQDGVQDDNEHGLAGVTVQLWNADRTVMHDAAVTESNGTYTLVAPGAGSYRMRVLKPDDVYTYDWVPKDATSDTLDSDVNPTGTYTGYTDVYTWGDNIISVSSVDAGLKRWTPIIVGNRVWKDVDADGSQDAGETGLAGVTLQLWNASKTVLHDSTVTNGNGNYTLYAPRPGDYRVRVVLPVAGDAFAPKNAAADDQTDSDINPGGIDAGFTDIYTFAENLISTSTIDAGLLKVDVDLTVLLHDVPAQVNESEVQWQVLVGNAGPGRARYGRLDHPLPPGLQAMSWTCTAFGTAVCMQSAGDGAIDTQIDLPVDQVVRFDVAASVMPGPPVAASVQAYIDATSAGIETQPIDNTDSATIVFGFVFADSFESP